MNKPFAFQLEGAKFLASRFHAANGDEPGLGKTIQAVLAVDMLGAAKRVLVTCPASVRSNWREHFNGWTAHGNEDVDVVSYDGARLESTRAQLRDKYDVWIGDEIHFCKTVDSKRTRAIFGSAARDGFEGLARRATYKWPLSGTLAPNGRPAELFPLLKNLHPKFRDVSFVQYAHRYCGAFWDGRELNIKGATNLAELHALLEELAIMRTEAEVFPDRQAPLVSRIGVELSAGELAAVHAAEDEIGGREARLSSSFEKASQLGDTSRLSRLLGLAMVERVVQFVSDKLETVDKVVVFFKHTDVGAALLKRLAFDKGLGCSLYQGGMTDAAKTAAVAAFAQPSCQVFLGQQQAAGTGINGLQQVSSTVVFAEPDWTPGETEQRIRRLHRIGQKDPLVRAYIMYARETLSAVMVMVHDLKDERRGVLQWGKP